MFKLGRISGNEPHSQQRPGKRPRAAMAASAPENTDAARPCPGPKAGAPPPPAEASAHAAAAGADARGRQLLIVTEQVRVTSDCTCHARHDLAALARYWHQPLAQHARADRWHTVGTEGGHSSAVDAEDPRPAPRRLLIAAPCCLCLRVLAGADAVPCGVGLS